MKIPFALLAVASLCACSTRGPADIGEHDKLRFLREQSRDAPSAVRNLADDAHVPAAWLPFAGIDVQSYAFALKATRLGDPVLEASVRIDLRADPQLGELRFHVERDGIEIVAVRYANKNVAFRYVDLRGNDNGLAGEAVAFAVPPQAHHVVDIAYRIKVHPENTQEGFFFAPDYRGTPVLSTRSWPYFARAWIPSHDHPSDQAKFSFDLDGPEGFEALASGRLVKREVKDGRVHARWELDHEIPTYAANVVFGKYTASPTDVCYDPAHSTLRRLDCSAGREKLRFVAYLPPGIPVKDSLRHEILKSADSVAWFSSSFGKYEFGADLGMIVAPHPFSMEHVGLITLVDAGAAVHEIAHQWFGNSVAIAHWGEFWIIEGFTTYMTGFYDEVLTGRNTACKMSAGTLNNSPSVDPMDIFDQVAYCKGAAALDALRMSFAQVTQVAKGSAPEQAGFVALMQALYADYRLKPLSSSLLQTWLQLNAERVLARAGLRARSGDIASAVDNWKRSWFVAQ